MKTLTKIVVASFTLAALIVPAASLAQGTSAQAGAHVEITGIMATFGKKEVLLRVTEASAVGQPAAAARSLILREGGKDGMIEVVKIDVKNGTVRIKNAGREQTLSTAGISPPGAVTTVTSTSTTTELQTIAPELPAPRTVPAVAPTQTDGGSQSPVVVFGRRPTPSTPPEPIGIVSLTNGQNDLALPHYAGLNVGRFNPAPTSGAAPTPVPVFVNPIPVPPPPPPPPPVVTRGVLPPPLPPTPFRL